MKGDTQAALRAHMKKWGNGKGFNANPLDAQKEEIRFLCKRIDGVAKSKEKRARKRGTS